jgi:uncharacterized protein (DUF433 family)
MMIKKIMDQELLNRITINLEIFGGKPIIRNIRIKVNDIIDMLAAGMKNEEILEDFPYLELEDIKAALMFASLKL